MTERQKSQRWVNSVPTYEDYEDDYCYENDNEYITGKSTSHEELPQGQPEINSSSEPEQNDHEEVVHTSEVQRLVSLMSQPGNDSDYISPEVRINETVANLQESPSGQKQPQKEEEKESLVDPVATNNQKPIETDTNQEQVRLVLSVDQQDVDSNAGDIDSLIEQLNDFDSRRWTRNTSRFPTPLINDDDSESINYSPNSSLAEKISILNTKPSSVPKTINVGSGLNDHSYQKPLFREERLTPAASEDDFSTQKYHSLIPPDIRVPSDSSETRERKRSVSTSTVNTDATVNITPKITSPPPPPLTTPGKYPVSDWKSIIVISRRQDRITAFKQALLKEQEYDSGIQLWLNYASKQEPIFNSNLLIGKVASQAYRNASHNNIRRQGSLRTKVNFVKDKVEGKRASLGKTTSSLSKTTGELGSKVFTRGRNFFRLPKGDNSNS